MKIEIQDNELHRVFIIKGPLDSDTLRHLEKIFMDFLENDSRGAIVDIKDVGHIDSFSLAAFLKMKNRLLEEERRFKLINPPDTVKKVIEIANLESLLLEDKEC